MIYLDNAASGRYKPRCVIKAVTDALLASANPGRSGHDASLALALEVERCREKLTAYFGAEGANVVFTKNCTEALNLAIFGACREGSHVVTTALEHNSVLRPLYRLASLGKIDLTVLSPSKDGCVPPYVIGSTIKENTSAVVITHVSNVTGATNDIRSIGKMLAGRGVKLIVDCAQSAGHLQIRFHDFNIDAICAPGHKGMYAPQGTGFCIFREGLRLSPLLYGGTGSSSDSVFQPYTAPDGFESGTLNTPGICGLSSAVDWITENAELIRSTASSLTSMLLKGLSSMPEVELYTDVDEISGVVSFNVDGATSSELSDFYNEKKFAVRSGLHCAPLIHAHLGTLERGAVRVSPAYPNTERDVLRFLSATEEAIKIIKRRGGLYE